MTYFVEFHTPRGIFTSKPMSEGDAKDQLQAFLDLRFSDRAGFMIADGSVGRIALTTEIIRQTVLVIREAE